MKNITPWDAPALLAIDLCPNDIKQSYPPAPPCAQPMDPLTKHLAWGFGLLAAALVVALNMPPSKDTPPAPPVASCPATAR